MREKVCRFEVRLSQSEMANLNCKARKSGLSRSDYIRKVLSNSRICEAPPVDFITLIRETKRIGSNVEQLLRLANAKHILDVPRLRKDLDEWEELQRQMWEAYRPVNS